MRVINISHSDRLLQSTIRGAQLRPSLLHVSLATAHAVFDILPRKDKLTLDVKNEFTISSLRVD